MTFNTSFGLPGTRTRTAIVAAIAMLVCSSAWAQTIETINGADISTDVYNMYLESRIQKPASEATPQERTRYLDELKDIYLLTTQPKADALAKTPRNKAMIELQTRGFLAQAVAADMPEILEAYREQMALAPPLEFKASHILVETQSQALDLISKLEDGADFAELAKENSTGPSGPNGGDLGWFSANQMVAPFSQAVAALENGAFSKAPVQTQFGWHVILRVDSRESTPPTLESVRDVVKQRVEQDKLQEYLQNLRATLSE